MAPKEGKWSPADYINGLAERFAQWGWKDLLVLLVIIIYAAALHRTLQSVIQYALRIGTTSTITTTAPSSRLTIFNKNRMHVPLRIRSPQLKCPL
ncbi:hypothetical protein N7533_001701 [Penicillium manginii]|uniref:uncharacterized protein n=1 Tax=Penicillium manginii TaxID=203109 RepID=UPI002548F659|nr:uncharacterized protein N7533_001701 [Penicillium manginii]KAJ5763020.1 hypothetical protein N7533_001701 [Penicillium manginii]